MAFTQDEKDELKRIVLIETENIFSGIALKYQSMKDREKMNYLLDLEVAMKDRLIEFESAENN